MAYQDETKCLYSGYDPKDGEPGQIPIIQSTTYRFKDAEHIARLFDMPVEYIYSRFANPTVAAVEGRIADLEGGVGAMCTTSGQAATFLAIVNILSAGDSLISSSSIYGGSINLFSVTLKRFGIEVIYVDVDAPYEEILTAFKPNTKAVFGETIANPALTVLDIEKWSKAAHENGVPFIIDNTFATPIFCKPFQFGADIVVHSTSKYMDGHAVQIGGVIVDSGNFNWENGKFPEFTTPDESYHGVVYSKVFGKLAYIIKARMQLMRDIGCYPAAHSAFLLNMGLETLAVRMPRYSENGLKVAEFLTNHPKVERVRYPGLKTDKYYPLAQKYLPKGTSAVISFDVQGGREAAVKVMNGLKLICKEVHVSDIRSCCLHPASTSHRQLTDQQLIDCGVNPSLIRVSVGLENIDDIIADLQQSLDQE